MPGSVRSRGGYRVAPGSLVPCERLGAPPGIRELHHVVGGLRSGGGFFVRLRSDERSCQSRSFRRSLDALTSAEAEIAANLLEGFLTDVYPGRIRMTSDEVGLPENHFKTVPRGWLRGSFQDPDELLAYIESLGDSYRFEACYLVQEHLAARLSEESSESYVESLPPLLSAARKGQVSRVRELLRSGEDPDQTDEESLHTPLGLAASADHTRVVRMLLAWGASVDLAGTSGTTALMGAALDASRATARALLAAGASIEHRDVDNDTALTCAAGAGNAPVLRLLLRRGADVNARGDGEFTALMYAAESGRHRVVELLLAAGALDLLDEDGHDAAWHARCQGFDDIADLLEERFTR